MQARDEYILKAEPGSPVTSECGIGLHTSCSIASSQYVVPDMSSQNPLVSGSTSREGLGTLAPIEIMAVVPRRSRVLSCMVVFCRFTLGGLGVDSILRLGETEKDKLDQFYRSRRMFKSKLDEDRKVIWQRHDHYVDIVPQPAIAFVTTSLSQPIVPEHFKRVSSSHDMLTC